MLTPDPGRRAQRLLDAARAQRDTGALDAALGLLVAVEAGPIDPPQATQVQLLRGQVAWMQRRAGDAARLLLDAARRLDPVNAALARETHLEALAAAVWAGDLGRPGGVREAAEAARAAPPGPDPPSALAWLSERTRVTPTEWALGIEARVRALLSAGEAAETLYRESIAHLSRSRAQVELARGHLLYGEWLRRERRRMDAREQLRTAHTMLDAMGIGAFADRARRELAATGETARKRTVQARDELTAQEAQIALLARDGLSNPEIGARLFISARTVQYHLSKVFTKLAISSRSQLDGALAEDVNNAGLAL